MGVKFKTVKDDFPKMEASLKGLNGKKVNVGILSGGEQAWLAGIHEYGLNITVTEKMRKYLHSQGLHLKPSTTEIHIPERSFLRTGHDTHIDKILDKVDKALIPALLDGDMDSDRVCTIVGEMLRDRIVDFATNLKEPALHPFTLQRKKGTKTNPLNDSGHMIGAIDFEVK